MKTYSVNIEGITVFFSRIENLMSWYCSIDGQEYGSYITVDDSCQRGSTQEKECFKVLEVNAESSLKQILK